MFAVIKTGGKQYRVSTNDLLKVEKLEGKAGDTIELKEVLLYGEGEDVVLGAPFVKGAVVSAEIIEQMRGPKVIAFKKRRRQNSKRSRGHRQELSLIRIGEILVGGKKEHKARAASKKDTQEQHAKEASSAHTANA